MAAAPEATQKIKTVVHEALVHEKWRRLGTNPVWPELSTSSVPPVPGTPFENHSTSAMAVTVLTPLRTISPVGRGGNSLAGSAMAVMLI